MKHQTRDGLTLKVSILTDLNSGVYVYVSMIMNDCFDKGVAITLRGLIYLSTVEPKEYLVLGELGD